MRSRDSLEDSQKPREQKRSPSSQRKKVRLLMDLFQTNSRSRRPKQQAGVLSLIFVSWVNSLLRTGFNRPLKDDDLHDLPDEYDAEEIVELMEDAWENEVMAAKKQERQPMLWCAVLQIFPLRQYVFVVILKLLQTAMSLTFPLLLWFYLKIQEDSQRYPKYAGFLCAVAITIDVLLDAFAGRHHDLQTKLMAINLKIALIGIIHKKILQAQRYVLSAVTTGHIQNLISSDVQRMDESYVSLSYFLTTPIILVTSFTMLLLFTGWQSLSGLTIVLFLGFLAFFMAKKYAMLRRKQAKLTDERLGILHEVILGIRAVKTYAWEQSFMNLIMEVRRKELGYVIRKMIFSSVNMSVSGTFDDVTTLVTIVTLVYTGIQLFSFDIFTLAAVFGILRDLVVYNIDYCYRSIQDAIVSLQRIQQFLCKIDLELGQEPIPFEASNHRSRRAGSMDKSLMQLTGLSAAWNTGQQDVVHDINFKASPNQLIVITGPVGSGKSSLLMAIQGEIPRTSGQISYHGKIAYVSQAPWTFSGTVRDNIIFGKTFNKEKYQEILDLCGLQKDMKRFPKGDLSMIGERGIVLSGGQRSRVSLARAMYSEADIVLLDDPLSAVDAKVGEQIFEKCICNEMSGCLRILVTHQLQYLHRADWIIMLKDGHIEDQGSYEQLKLRGMIQQGHVMEVAVDNRATSSIPTSKEGDESHGTVACDLVEEDEEKNVGHVTWRLYWSFLRTGSNTASILSFLLFFLAVQALVFAPNILQTFLANMSYSNQRNLKTLFVYFGLVCASFSLSTLRNFLVYHLLIKSSRNLHASMAEAVIKSPVLFFDSNPTGRVMNRFSRDIGIIDDELPRRFDTALSVIVRCLGVVVMTAVINLWFVVVIVPLGILSYYACLYYLKTSRELTRMAAIRYSPVYAHVTETIRGLEVIRTSQREQWFVDELIRLQNQHTKAFHLVVALKQWFALRFDLLVGCLVISVAFIGLFAIKDKALAGMLLAVTSALLGRLEHALRMACEVETNMTSVERVMAYSCLPSEEGYSRPGIKTENWPEEGMLTLKDVSLQYVQNGVQVLKDINLQIQPRDKIGIVGRTGAGKSSLVAAILRMHDPHGQVLIDGIDLGTIHIQAARTAVAVISQDPFLFAGSLRRTLDPFNRFTDQQIWTALEQVQLNEMVHRIPGKLKYRVGEFGTGFSAGERQLLCLARALLEKRQIMILDEVTANVDYQTDQLIQHVIRNKFKNQTVLTIAHRINTIMDYDKVIVMDQGRVAEYDNPAVLAGKSDSKFYELIRKQGISIR